MEKTSKKTKKMKKIDMHCHTTNRKVDKVLESRATLNRILEKMQEHDIEKTVVLASYFPHRSSGISNFRLLHWLQENGNKNKFYFFGSLDFEHYFYQGFNELSELAEKGKLNGIKVYTGYQKIDLNSHRFREVVNLAKNNNLPMMFHTGYSYMARRRYNKPSIEKMVKASDLEFIAKEGVNVIASHLGKPFFDNTIETANRNSNFYSDVSGLVNSRYDKREKEECVDAVREFLEKAGPDKLLFGTDFPVQTHEDSIYFVEEAMKGFDYSDKRKVYYQNARRILENEK